MSNLEDFQAAIVRLREQDAQIEDQILADCKTMSDTRNWVCVHATRYMPPRNPDGTMFIPTTAMVTNYDIPRTTVHVTLNHVVKSHNAGAWEDCPYVVFAPYTKVVEKNAAPKCVSLYDTFFVPNSEHGLLLPDDAYLVQPSDNDEDFYHVGEHTATYKHGNYTPTEIEFILSLMPSEAKQKYKEFANYTLDASWTFYYFDIDIHDDNERYKILSTKYKQQMDKYGTDLLSSYLRNYVVRLAMESKGFQYVTPYYSVSRAACDALAGTGISTEVDEKSHWGSIEHEMENAWSAMRHQDILVLNKYEIKYLYELWVEKPYSKWLHDDDSEELPEINISILDAIVNNKPMHFYQKYCDKFASVSYRKTICKTIAEYNPDLDIALRKNSQILETEFQKAVQTLKQNPRYPKFERLAKKVLERFATMTPDDFDIPYWGLDSPGINQDEELDWSIPPPIMRPPRG